MRNWLIILCILVNVSILAGCELSSEMLNKVDFWDEEKSDVQQENGSQEETEQEKKISVSTAEDFNGEKNTGVYGSRDYSQMASSIKSTTIDNFILGVINNETSKSGDNPYLIGDDMEDENTRNAVENLKNDISEVNPINWQIVQLKPVKENTVLIAVEYYLPDGRNYEADEFFVENRGGEWFIDFDSFNESFHKVANYSRVGDGTPQRNEIEVEEN